MALGATAVVTQIVLLREFLSIFQGNELVIGFVLGCWMLLTGVGALLGKNIQPWADRRDLIPYGLLSLGALPLLTVFFLRFLRGVLFTPGSMVPILQAFLTASFILVPFCFVSGFSFTLLATALSTHVDRSPAAVAYSWESLGSAAAGLLFSLLLLPRLETFQVLCVLLILNAGLAGAIALMHRFQRILWTSGLLILVGFVLLAFGNLDLVTRRYLFPGQSVAFFRDTPYGNLTVTRQEEQISLFENGVLLFSSNDIIAKEESVHFAMVQRQGPKDVLLIGGGISGTPAEVLKYGVTHLDYAEMNPWILQIGREFTHALRSPRIRVFKDDGRRHVRSTHHRYDVVLFNIPDPETIQLNRYYTIEFFRSLKRVLTDSAVVSMSLLSAAEYQGPEARRTLSSLYATLHHAFAHVLIVPGNRYFLLASDLPLDIHIGHLIDQREVQTAYVNKFYLDDQLLERRSQELEHSLDAVSPINTDFEPISYYHQIGYWLSYFGTVPEVWILLGVVAILLLLWRFSTVGMGIFVGGVIGVSVEILLLLVFQALAGSLYEMIGTIIACFMGGLAVGSWCVRRFLPQVGMRAFVAIQICVGILCFLLPPLFLKMQSSSWSAAELQAFFSVLGFFVAALLGMEFAIASNLGGRTPAATAADLYGLDLAGSSLGATTVSVYAIPFFGVTHVSMILGTASVAAALWCTIARKGR